MLTVWLQARYTLMEDFIRNIVLTLDTDRCIETILGEELGACSISAL